MNARFMPPIDHQYRVHDAVDVEIDQLPTEPPNDAPPKSELKEKLGKKVQSMAELQRKLYAEDRRALLVVFQAMDAGGKDGTIRNVFSGINPAGVDVHSFKQPSTLELAHDFLWRVECRTPERGHIGVFNRSHYEEVLVVRVHPAILESQRLHNYDVDTIWSDRFKAINDFEERLAANGTTILKFFLNVSKKEQAKRLLARIEEPKSNWKFDGNDVVQRQSWDAYQHAYQELLRHTSKPWAPWFAIPADDKSYMRLKVAEIIEETLKTMDPQFPEVTDAQRTDLKKYKEILRAD
ncbi:MAG: polyphosphate kinase 2 family protein [Polyangiales bacterium]